MVGFTIFAVAVGDIDVDVDVEATTLQLWMAGYCLKIWSSSN